MEQSLKLILNLNSGGTSHDKNYSLINKNSRNGFINNKFFERILIIDQSFSLLIILQLLLQHIYFEMDLINDPNTQWFNWLSFVTGLVCCVILYSKHVTNNQFETDSSSIKILSIKLAFMFLMPFPYLNNIFIKIHDMSTTIPTQYQFKLNYLLIILTVFRTTFYSTSMLIRNKYMSPRADRICQMYGAQPGFIYCIRSIFKDSPFLFITSIFMISVFIFSFLFRVAENNIYSQESSLWVYNNMIWMTIITMTTVGYGDYTPKTEVGRLIGAVCVSWGVLIVSVMVVVLTNAFRMDRNQSQSLNILRKLDNSRQLRQLASKYIRQSLWRLWKNYKYKINYRQKMKERKLMIDFRHYRRVNMASGACSDDIDFYNEMVRQFDRATINLQNLTANNLMIINYLNEEYIFKNPFNSESLISNEN